MWKRLKEHVYLSAVPLGFVILKSWKRLTLTQNHYNFLYALTKQVGWLMDTFCPDLPPISSSLMSYITIVYFNNLDKNDLFASPNIKCDWRWSWQAYFFLLSSFIWKFRIQTPLKESNVHQEKSRCWKERTRSPFWNAVMKQHWLTIPTMRKKNKTQTDVDYFTEKKKS